MDVISPTLDQDTRTCEVLIRFANPEGRYRPGMFVRAEIAGVVYHDKLMAPKSALLIRDNRPLVFKREDDRARWLYVDIGLENEQWVEILKVHSGGRIAWAVRQGSPKLRESLNAFLQETISGVRVIQLFGQEARARRSFARRNKAVVGENAFAHEAGIHQDGMLKERTTYEIMNPSDIGLTKGNLVLGKHSGRHALKDRIEVLGYVLSEEELERVFTRFKSLADLRKEIFDEDIEAIIMDEIIRIPEVFELVSSGVMSGSMKLPTAAVRLKVDGVVKEGAAIGVGPIDATYRAIADLTGTSSKLLFFSVSSFSGGTDAQGDVLIRIEDNGKVVIGHGLDPDIITAAGKAYLNGLNRLVYLQKEANKK